MKHLGDITQINGADIEPVDVITGGSPCQDLSVAGKRAGLSGERSGLYMDQIRIIKEMRQHERDAERAGEFIRPRYMVWENVPGAFSSNGGKDFGAVIEEAISVSEPKAPAVPVPDGGWPMAGCLYASDGSWSVAWRQHDAQYWGTPQRRKRIALVADFGGSTAAEILFERKGVPGNTEPGGAAWKGSAGDTESGAGSAGYTLKIRGGREGGEKGALIQYEKSATFSTLQDQTMIQCAVGCDVYNQDITGDVAASLTAACGGSNTSGGKVLEPTSFVNMGHARTDGVSETLRSQCGGDYPCVCEHVCLESNQNHARATQDGLSPTLTASMGMGGGYAPMVTENYCIGNGQADQTSLHKIAGALNCMHDQQAVLENDFVGLKSIVRRLTPMECERLQGFPDGWTDIGDWTDSKGKLHKASDTPRYKALGNSIAVGYANNRSGFWMWLMKRISAQYERTATLGSLFDGIGGFPLAWEAVNGKGTARWASEIEEFPIAVTKYHFPEEERDEQ